MKVYLAGHEGFVGSNLLKKLDGFEVITSPRNFDLRDQKATEEFFEEHKPDWVFQCAAVVGGIKLNMENPFKFLYDNLQIQNNLINSSLKTGVKKFLFLGSSCIYPKDYRQPLVEEDLLAAPLEPTNEGYALAKISGLKLCEYSNRKQSKTKFISLMPCNLYGPGDHFDLERSHVLSALVKKIVDAHDNGLNEVVIWGSGRPKREWLYVEDLADCMVWCMENLESVDTFLNVGSGWDVSILDLAKKIADAVGFKGEFVFDSSKPDGMMKKCLDVSKINELGWSIKTPFEEGLKNTIEYYRGIK